MSFTSNIKNEISKIKPIETEIISELSAIIKNGAEIKNTIIITTENASVARRIYKIFREVYQLFPKITVRKGYNYHKNILYILEIKEKTKKILEETGIVENGQYKIFPAKYIIDDPDLIKAYLRGIFFMSGSVNDPKKSRYHLEFVVNEKEYAKFIKNILNENYLNAKILKRDTKYMVYVKESEKIGDFLRLIGAYNSLFYYEDIRIYRDHKNMTNRLNNCEQANVERVIENANKQLKSIEKIEQNNVLDILDDKEKEVIYYRKKYPETSLGELSEIITYETGIKITKSGIYHRFKKIEKFAEKLNQQL